MMKQEMDRFLGKIARNMEKFHMADSGDHILTALSGGADSVCLLLALVELQEHFGYRVSAVHVEHGIRGQESLDDMKFSETLCHKLGVEFHCVQVDAPAAAKDRNQGLEETARELRYQVFTETAQKLQANRVFLAHHQDDQAETVLFRMSRGTGLRGLKGMEPVRRLFPEEGAILLCRPLLTVSRKEIETWLEAQDQGFCFDRTNEDTAYARNRIRHEVIPALLEVNEGAVAHISRMSEEMMELDSYVQQQVQILLETCRENCRDGVLLKELEWSDSPKLLRRYAILQLLGELTGNRKDLGNTQVEQVLALASMQTGKTVNLPYEMKAVKVYEGIRIIKDHGTQKPTAAEAAVELKPGGRIVWGDWEITADLRNWNGEEEIPEKSYTKWLDYDKIYGCLFVRSRMTGDVIQVNAEGGHKKLKDYFIDRKVPADIRDGIPLLAAGEEILWIMGYRMSESCKVTDTTKRVLIVEAKKENIK